MGRFSVVQDEGEVNRETGVTPRNLTEICSEYSSVVASVPVKPATMAPDLKWRHRGGSRRSSDVAFRGQTWPTKGRLSHL